MARKPSAPKTKASRVLNRSKSAKVPNNAQQKRARELLENRHYAVLKFTHCFPGSDPTGAPLSCYADMVMCVHDLVNWYRLLRMPNARDMDVLTTFLDNNPLCFQVG